MAIVIQSLYAAIFIISLVTIERLLYFYFQSPRDIQQLRAECPERHKHARDARLRLWRLLGYRLCAERLFWLVRALVAVCPLLGLLGTVLGMSDVFDTVAHHGEVINNGFGNRLALLTTAAMVPALTGMAALIIGLGCLWGLRRCAGHGRQRLEA